MPVNAPVNAPEELFFVHIEVRDMKNLPSKLQRYRDKGQEFEKKKQQYSRHY